MRPCRRSFDHGARIVRRLSCAGTEGATLRIDIERVETDPRALARDPQQALADPLSGLRERTGWERPDVVT